MTKQAPAKKDIAVPRKTLPQLLNDADTIKRFQEMLGKDARSFQQNILTVYNGSNSLQQCDPESIVAACAISASINLSILPSLGQSCIVPYKDGDRMVATFQLQWKGLVQLAHRSAQYKRVNLAHVYEGQLVAYDEFKGLVTLNAENRKSDRVQGYYFFFELLNGLQMEFYWSAKKCVEHGLRFSKSFQSGQGKWTEDAEFEKAGSVKKWLAAKEQFLTDGSGADAMSAKTIVKNSLNKWGPLETRIKEIVSLDQAVIGPDGQPTYIDATTVDGDGAPAASKVYEAPPARQLGKEVTPAEKLAWARDAAKKQGVPHEQFDAWVAAQPGDEAAKAEAATITWKKVALKEAKAVDVFAVSKAATETGARFQVSGVATAEVDGNPDCFCIRDTSEPALKYYTDSPEIADAAKAAKKSEALFGVLFVEKGEGKNAYRWITRLA